MKAAKISMLGSLTLLVAALTAASVGTVRAQVSPPSPVPKVVARAQQPVGTPHKVSSFAPRPTKRRVFGAPIQAPILRHVPAPKKSGPK
jgi:hypothetical protein